MRSLHIEICASDDLQNIKEASRFEIRRADVATSDDTNGGFSVHRRIKSFLTMCFKYIFECANIPDIYYGTTSVPTSACVILAGEVGVRCLRGVETWRPQGHRDQLIRKVRSRGRASPTE